jgi:integrase
MATVPFTTAFVRKATCPPGTAKVTLFDAEVKGFMLEVRPSSSKTYYQRYTDSRGRQRQFKIGSADILTLEQARKQARKILAEAIVGGDPQAKRAELRATPTLNEFIRDQYMPHVKGYKRSWKTDEIVIRCHIAGPLGPLPMDTVTADRISDVVRQMRAKGRASGTTNRVVILLRYIFNLAIRWKVPGVTENPTATLSLAPDVQRERFLSKGEIKRLVAAIQADENQVAANAIMLLLLTGARRNEITFAKWEYLDLEQSTRLVPVSKSGKPRKIILSELAVNLLRSITPVPRNPWIFPSPVTGRPSPSLHFPWVTLGISRNPRTRRPLGTPFRAVV